MILGILFDMGGTLDSDGRHWLERFLELYRANGVVLPRGAVRAAFDAAEQRAASDEAIATASFSPMIERHVAWQLEHLRIATPALQRAIVDGFVAPVRDATRANARLLADLSRRGFRLGVLSNGCGNVDVLCAEFGYAPSLTAIVDSRRVGMSKPDPAIFAHAAAALGIEPARVLMVGDSFERDIRPAGRAGMRTAWLEGPEPRECPDSSLVDIRLRSLADLPTAPLVLAAAGALTGVAHAGRSR